MTFPYRLLLVDNNAEHVRLMGDELRKIDVALITRVIQMKKDFIPALEHFDPHIIISGHSMTPKVYHLLQESGKKIPFIAVDDDLMKEGEYESYQMARNDYLLKTDVKRLAFTVSMVLHWGMAEAESRMLKNRLNRTNEDLRLLYENYENAREQEKLAISRELHDEVGQILTALKIDINLLRKKVVSNDVQSQNAIETEFAYILKTIDKSTQRIRKIAAGLRPDILDKLGLIDAVEWLAEEASRRDGFVCKTDLPEELPFIDEYYSVTIFRIVQETLTNVIRHAEASEAFVRLTIEDNTLHLRVTDNGKGITDEKMRKSNSLGIVGLRERVRSLNGRLNIKGSESEGTVVSVIIPIDTRVKQEKV